MTHPLYTPDHIQRQMAVDYASGMSRNEVAAKYDLSDKVVRNACKKFGVPMRDPRCPTDKPKKSLVGQTFGQLTVLGISPVRKIQSKLTWLCQCTCGNTCLKPTGLLNRKIWHSCGCITKNRLTPDKLAFHKSIGRTRYHGSTARPDNTPECISWVCMKRRCSGFGSKRERHHYFDRGIRVCRRWADSYYEFLADMGPMPGNGYTVERNDVNGNYSCGKCEECVANGWTANCRWATKREQTLNKRNTIWVQFRGETKSLREWADELGLSYFLLHARITKSKWPADKAFTEPIRKQGPGYGKNKIKGRIDKY